MEPMKTSCSFGILETKGKVSEVFPICREDERQDKTSDEQWKKDEAETVVKQEQV